MNAETTLMILLLPPLAITMIVSGITLMRHPSRSHHSAFLRFMVRSYYRRNWEVRQRINAQKSGHHLPDDIIRRAGQGNLFFGIMFVAFWIFTVVTAFD